MTRMRTLLGLGLLAWATAVGADDAVHAKPGPSPDSSVIYDSLMLRSSYQPFIEFQQDSPLTQWFVMAGETGFVVADAGLPFHIAPGSPDYSLWIHPAGVCIGCYTSDSKLYVYSTDPGTANARLSVREASPTTASRNMLRILNNGASTFRFDNTATGTGWGFGSRQLGDFFISPIGSPAIQLSLTADGNLTIAGALTQGSDRNAKNDVTALDPGDVLARVSSLPIATWRYKGDGAWHAGPMAQDFYAAFGLGADDKHIAPADMAGLGLAAVQALNLRLAEREAELADLAGRLQRREADVRELSERLDRIETSLHGPGSEK